MVRALFVHAAAALLVAGCTHDASSARYAKRGEPVGVNSVPATTDGPSPTAMGTTTASGSETNR